MKPGTPRGHTEAVEEYGNLPRCFSHDSNGGFTKPGRIPRGSGHDQPLFRGSGDACEPFVRLPVIDCW